MPKLGPEEAKAQIEMLLLNSQVTQARKVAEDFLKTRGKEFRDGALFYSAYCLQYDPLNPQYTLAASRYQSLLQDYPDTSLREEALFQLGQCFQNDPDWPDPQNALKWTQQLLAAFPSGVRAHRALYEQGLCLEAIGQPTSLEEALSCYQRLVDAEGSEPWATRALYRMAQIEEKQMGRYEEAVDRYKAFLQKDSPERDAERKSYAQLRVATLLTERLDREDEGSQWLAALMSESSEDRWKVVVRQRMQSKSRN